MKQWPHDPGLTLLWALDSCWLWRLSQWLCILSWRQINIHWLHLAHMAWVNVLTPVPNFSQYGGQSQHQCHLGCCWPVLQNNGDWMIWDQGWDFETCLVCLNLELPLSMMGPFTGGFENSGLHCALGTEVPWCKGISGQDSTWDFVCTLPSQPWLIQQP